MLKSRNLDDQTYRQIVETAESRLPYLCPDWTDHNAHDPGITILELMAWYKEMQQYRLNRFGEELRLRLLKLAGITRRPAAAAVCTVSVPNECPAREAGERLHTREGVPFELAEPVPAQRPQLVRICVQQGDFLTDVGELLSGRRMTFQPFAEGPEGRSRLKLGFSGYCTETLRLWFDVEQPEGPARNAFADLEQIPRVLTWDCPGGAEVTEDETHALSVSGFVSIRFTGDWTVSEDGLRWLTVSLADPGCEEEVRLSGIAANRFRAIQRETWAANRTLCASADSMWEIPLSGALEQNGTLAVFLRRQDGWAQTNLWQIVQGGNGALLRLDTTDCVQDEKDNVLLVALDSLRADQLLFDAKGLPGETFFLDLDGRTVLMDNFALLCETLQRDGTVCPALWHCVDDLSCCGPRDRVFAYDPARENITFGDGEHGALLQGGQGAVLVASMVLSRCGSGNIPAETKLFFGKNEIPVCSSAAAGGIDRETADEAEIRLRQYLNYPTRCVSASDYETFACKTPGLRVAAVKAIPAWDPNEPTGVSRTPTVTVVVVPAGSGARPMPDDRFLESVRRQLDRVRPIGTRVLVIPPVYAEISIHAEIYGAETDESLPIQRLRDCLEQQVGIGGTVRVGDISAVLQSLPGVLRVRRVEIRFTGGMCRQDSSGDLYLPRQGVPCLTAVHIQWLRTEQIGE